MIYDPIKEREVEAIPKRAQEEWKEFTAGISDSETNEIIEWINKRFDEVANSRERVQPSGWLGSGFNWKPTPLYPIYRECKSLMSGSEENKIQEKAGQIFGLFVSLTLADHNDNK